MKPFEEKFTAWIDGELNGQAVVDFEAELAKVQDAQAEKVSAHKLGDLLRTHGRAPELGNADFFNHQLMQAIESDARRAEVPAKREASWRSAWRMAWGGIASLAVAVVLFAVVIPHGPVENPTSGEYVSQIIKSSTEDPSILATSFHSKKDNVSVLWLDGLDYVPENYKLK